MRMGTWCAIDPLRQILVIITFENFLSLFSHGKNGCAGR